MIITLAFALLSTASRQCAHDIISQLQTEKTEFNSIPETKHKQREPEYAEYCSGSDLRTHF